MIEPNFNLLLWIFLISTSIGAISRIVLGVSGVKKSINYGADDVVVGIIEMIIIVWVVIG